MHYYQQDDLHHEISAVQDVEMQMLEILGINRTRVVFVGREVGKQAHFVGDGFSCSLFTTERVFTRLPICADLPTNEE